MKISNMIFGMSYLLLLINFIFGYMLPNSEIERLLYLIIIFLIGITTKLMEKEG